MKLGIVSAILLWIGTASASVGPKAVLWGHNLSPTTNVLADQQITIGNYLAAAGITKNVSLGVSPWMYFSYNMHNIVGRVAGELDGKRRWGVQAAHFKTGRFYPDIYQMEAASVWVTGSQDLAPFYTLNLTANYMYFFDETIPFSLRREPFNDDPYQVTLSTLQVVRLPWGFGLAAELGILGLNYTYPQLLFGGSMNYQGDHFMVQVGFSQNTTVSGIQTLYTQDQGRGHRYRTVNDDSSMHPEIQLQFYF